MLSHLSLRAEKLIFSRRKPTKLKKKKCENLSLSLSKLYILGWDAMYSISSYRS